MIRECVLRHLRLIARRLVFGERNPRIPLRSQTMSTPIAVKPTSQMRNVFEDLEATTRAIAQRAFSFFEQRGTNGEDVADWFRAQAEILKPVPIELIEADDSYILRAEVPGFDAKDLEIQADAHSIYVRGKTEKKHDEKKGRKVQYSEVLASEVCRYIDLPESIHPEKASAHLKKGVLELTLPKAAAASKKIEVTAA